MPATHIPSVAIYCICRTNRVSTIGIIYGERGSISLSDGGENAFD